MDYTIAELIVYNGKIWTGDPTKPEAQALAVADGKILIVGSDKEVLENYNGTTTARIDLQGKRLIPGLNDSHMHLFGVGSQLEHVELGGCRSCEELVNRMKAAPQPEGDGWINGRGFNHEQFEDHRMPTRHDLDQVSIEHPVMAVRTCGHVAICNTKLLQMAGIVKGFGQVEGGEIGYDTDGEPNGLLAENAIGLVGALSKQATQEDYKRIITGAVGELLKVGLTSVQSDDLGGDQWNEKVAAYHELSQEGLNCMLNNYPKLC